MHPRSRPRMWLAVFLAMVTVTGLVGSATVRADDGTEFKTYLPIISRYIPPEWLGPIGGSIINIVADRRNPSVLYAGSSGGGVYKSTNGGETWNNSSQGMGSVSIYSLAIDPENSAIIYAGSYKKGVYRSTDAGASWTPVGSGTITGAIIYTLEINPGNHHILYAGTRLPGTYNGNYVGHLYKSLNDGSTWTSVLSVTNDWVYDIAINPNSPETILAATHQHGLYRTTSYGGPGEWSHIDLGDDEYDKGRALAFDPRSGSKRAYYAAWHGDLFISTNNGQSWSYSSQGLGSTHVYPNGIEIRPNRPDSVYLAAHSGDIAGIMRSSNAGSSWAGAGLAGKTVYTVAAPAGSSNLIAGTYLEGIFKSTDEGASWRSRMAGVDNVQVTGVVALNDTTLYCSTISQGVMRSTDGGRSWSGFNTNLGDVDVNGLVQHPSNPNVLYALTTHAGLRRVDLGTGTSWSPVTIPAPAGLINGSIQPPASPFARFELLEELNVLQDASGTGAVQPPLVTAGTEGINTLAFAPSQPATAYLGTNGSGVYASSNGGASWASIGLNGAVIRQVIVHPNDPSLIYVLTGESGRVWYSPNRGANWQAVSLPDSQLVAYAASYLPGDPGTVVFGTTNGAWIYSGSTWTAAGLSGETIYTFLARPSSPGKLYAGTDTGVYASVDGVSWQRTVAELNLIRVQTIAAHSTNACYLFFGTSGRGILRACLP